MALAWSPVFMSIPHKTGSGSLTIASMTPLATCLRQACRRGRHCRQARRQVDSWYAAKAVMLHIEKVQKIYYCPLKSNRRVDDSLGQYPYQRIDSLTWTDSERQGGKSIKIRGFPKDHKVKLFRVVSSTGHTEHVVTNDKAQKDTQVAQQAWHWHWKIEQFHREAKQVTGLEKCQYRLARIVRNHIGCAFLVWLRLEQVAYQTRQSVYQVKYGLLDDYLRQQRKDPSIFMTLA